MNDLPKPIFRKLLLMTGIVALYGAFNLYAGVMPAKETVDELSFTEEPFISPYLLAEMMGETHFLGKYIANIDLGARRDRVDVFENYTVDYATNGEDHPEVEYVKWGEYSRSLVIRYRYIGKTDNGIHVIHVYTHAGGSIGPKLSALFIRIENDKVLSTKGATESSSDQIFQHTRDRRILNKVGQVRLGRRTSGTYEINGNVVHIECVYSNTLHREYKEWNKKVDLSDL